MELRAVQISAKTVDPTKLLIVNNVRHLNLTSLTPCSRAQTCQTRQLGPVQERGNNFDQMSLLPPPTTHMAPAGVQPTFAGHKTVTLTTEPRLLLVTSKHTPGKTYLCGRE